MYRVELVLYRVELVSPPATIHKPASLLFGYFGFFAKSVVAEKANPCSVEFFLFS